MKYFVFLVLMGFAFVSNASESCKPKVMYNCMIVAENNVISLLLEDRQTGSLSVFHTRKCPADDFNCKTNMVHYYSDKIRDFQKENFCY
jgi:hypothetical protein